MFGRSRRFAELSRFYFQHCRGTKSAPKLPITLSKGVEGLGSAGERLEVNQGFARNLLFPKRLAGYNLEAYQVGRKGRGTKAKDGAEESRKVSEEQHRFEQVLNKLLSSPVEVKRKKKRGAAIEGQVTAASIADAIAKQKRIDLAKEVIELQAPIIQHGTHEVPLGITLANGETAVMTVIVTP